MIIKRARGHRLYTQDGNKILDLSMDSGRAVLGHRPNGLSLTLKNAIDKGIYASYDNIYLGRLKKDLKKRFPDHPYITLHNYEAKIVDHFKTEIKDPLFDEIAGATLAYWRPFLETPDSENIILLYPMPGLNCTTLLISKNKIDLEEDLISPVLLAGILKSFYDYDMVNKKIDKKTYDVYNQVPNSVLKAPYLILDRDVETYNKLCLDASKSDIMLNSKKSFIVLPPDYSDGEIKRVLSLLS